MRWACSQRESLGIAGVGDELAVDDVGQPSFQASQGLYGCLAGGELASVVGAASVSWRICTMAATCRTWFSRRFPARESRWRVCSLDEASRVRCRSTTRAVAVADAAHVADIGQDLGCACWSDAAHVHQRRAAFEDRGLQLRLDLLQMRMYRARRSQASTRAGEMSASLEPWPAQWLSPTGRTSHGRRL
jgi:hypothetical protein